MQPTTVLAVVRAYNLALSVPARTELLPILRVGGASSQKLGTKHKNEFSHTGYPQESG